jgi:hypothetical protein
MLSWDSLRRLLVADRDPYFERAVIRPSNRSVIFAASVARIILDRRAASRYRAARYAAARGKVMVTMDS